MRTFSWKLVVTTALGGVVILCVALLAVAAASGPNRPVTIVVTDGGADIAAICRTAGGTVTIRCDRKQYTPEQVREIAFWTLKLGAPNGQVVLEPEGSTN